MPLSDTAIRKAKPTDKTQRLFDGGGLYLEITPAGGKLWRQKYRFGGKEKRLAHGTYPEVSLAEARERRDNARRLLAAGTDPGEHRKAEKQAGEDRAANSFEAVAREWFGKFAPNWAHQDTKTPRPARNGWPFCCLRAHLPAQASGACRRYSPETASPGVASRLDVPLLEQGSAPCG